MSKWMGITSSTNFLLQHLASLKRSKASWTIITCIHVIFYNYTLHHMHSNYVCYISICTANEFIFIIVTSIAMVIVIINMCMYNIHLTKVYIYMYILYIYTYYINICIICYHQHHLISWKDSFTAGVFPHGTGRAPRAPAPLPKSHRWSAQG